MTKDDFIQWRNSEVTREVFEVIAETASNAAAEIINRTTSNVESDMYKRGFIRGIQEILDWQPIFEEEKQLIEALEEEEDEI